MYISQRLVKRASEICLQFRKCMSTFSKDIREEATVVSEDGKVVVCWHPETEFPYEFTKPIPQHVDTSHLKLKYEESKDSFRKIHSYFEMKMLQELTYTNKHIWYPRPERKMIKFKEKEPKDREYL